MYSCVDERSAAYMANGLCAESGELDEEHLAYLRSLTTPEAIVWGNNDGTRNGHAYCLKTEKLNRTVDKLKALYPNVLEMSFDSFEALYKWVHENVMREIWVSAKVLNYDIALRLVANHIATGRLLPSANVYLHGKPWMAAKALDEKLKVREFRKPSSYLEHIFDCGNCNPRIKEHALCRYHNDFVQLSKKKGTSHSV